MRCVRVTTYETELLGPAPLDMRGAFNVVSVDIACDGKIPDAVLPRTVRAHAMVLADHLANEIARWVENVRLVK